MEGVKILFLDIETSPLITYNWGLWEQNAVGINQDWFILCFAYKWGHENTYKSYKLPDFKGYSKDKTNDKQLVSKIISLLDEADIVCGHNVKSFDLKKINTRAIVHGIKPPSPYQVIDTMSVSKSVSSFSSNRLNHITQQLGLGKKEDNGGFDTWLGCLSGDKNSWNKLEKYCKKDVKLLVDLYHTMKPWSKTHPNISSIVGEDKLCPRCGAEKLQRRGYGYTGMSTHIRYQCTSCGGWSRGANKKRVEIR